MSFAFVWAGHDRENDVLIGWQSQTVVRRRHFRIGAGSFASRKRRQRRNHDRGVRPLLSLDHGSLAALRTPELHLCVLAEIGVLQIVTGSTMNTRGLHKLQ